MKSSLLKILFLHYIQIEQFKSDKDAYELANNGVSGKSSLAIEILLNSKKEGSCDFSNWVVPTYIKEGLLWLRKD